MNARKKLLDFLASNPDMLTPQQSQRVEALREPQAPSSALALGAGSATPADPMFDDEDMDRCRCDRCGGDGFIEYNDGDGGDWGEDCPSEINHLIVCRACQGTGQAQ
jgi:hypothetical protein